jgi:type 1 glutamine amidotransferase
VVVIGENDIHQPFVEGAKAWLDKLAADSNLAVTYFANPNSLTDTLLAGTDVVWQANYTPYRWNASAKAAFEKYLNAGKGGWVGNHHGSLYGSVVTKETWPFYHKLIGEISYKNYVEDFASGDVRTEDSLHPVMKGVPAKFTVTTEEWYTWDKNPRPKVKVLANLDEASMKFVNQAQSGIKMGDHPVVWTYEGYQARNVYIFMGHHPNLFQNAAYTTLLRNALFWAANKQAPTAIRAGRSAALGVRAGKRGKARNLAGREVPSGAAGAAAWKRPD